MSNAATLPEQAETALQNLLALSPEQRLAISERLLADISLESTSEQQQEWDRRVIEFEADSSVGMPLEDSMKRLREQLDAQRSNSSRG